jgi:REP element-mobilizing transposase RayT
MIIGHHLIWTLYGHWLPNDLRGSGSSELREEKFAFLGPIHQGRKPKHLLPPRGELRRFYKQAEPLLKFDVFWIDECKRRALGECFAKVTRDAGYTVWACAILKNHAHMVIRRHRDDALAMWHAFADESRLAMRQSIGVAQNHPVWSARPCKVFLRTPEEVRGRIDYVNQNPEKEGLLAQWYDFVQSYNNWPFHKHQPVVSV